MEKEDFHKKHRQRMRTRVEQAGKDGLNDHELLELLLGYAVARKDTNELAHRLLDRFGTLRGVLEANPESYKEIVGMGAYNATFLQLIADLIRRYNAEFYRPGEPMKRADTRKNFYITQFIGRTEECMIAAFLDSHYRLLRAELQYTGSMNAVEIHADRLEKTVKSLPRCRWVVIGHNHFIDPMPSLQDITATRKVYRHLEKMQIGLLDHIIVCGNQAISMLETGHIELLRGGKSEGFATEEEALRWIPTEKEDPNPMEPAHAVDPFAEMELQKKCRRERPENNLR